MHFEVRGALVAARRQGSVSVVLMGAVSPSQSGWGQRRRCCMVVPRRGPLIVVPAWGLPVWVTRLREAVGDFLVAHMSPVTPGLTSTMMDQCGGLN